VLATLAGGLGGHSGVDIARGRANAIKVLARALREALTVAPFRLVSLNRGKSWNAIPRDATAICSPPAEREASFRRVVETAAATIRDAGSARAYLRRTADHHRGPCVARDGGSRP
jgi:dipeptidase D